MVQALTTDLNRTLESRSITEARNRADEILAEAKRQAEETRIAIQEGFKDLQRQKEEWQATQIRLDAEAKSEATALERDAKRTELISKAKDPKTQTLLRPFLDDGLWQPGRGNSIEFGPISLGALRKVGTLLQNQTGLRPRSMRLRQRRQISHPVGRSTLAEKPQTA